MSTSRRYTFTPATSPVLRWLTTPGAHVPLHIQPTLLGELFNSPTAILMGVINGLMLDALAVSLSGGKIFILFAIVDFVLSAYRYWVVSKTANIAARGLPASTDIYILTGILWCALQGTTIFAGMRTGIFPIQIFAAATAVGLMGPVCARNYPAPRFALLLSGLCDMPFIAALLMTGEPWTLMLLAQVPVYSYGCYLIITRYQRLSIDFLLSQHESLHRAAHDPLTNLLNRAGLEERLESALSASRKGMVVFFLDLDGFKTVNDTFGHEAGDLVLKDVATILRDNTRSGDIVARLGGDEFVIAAPGMPLLVANRLADLLIERIREETFKIGIMTTARVAVSIGHARYPEDGTSIEDLLRKADLALYEAKRSGKGIHRSYTVSPKPPSDSTPIVLDLSDARLELGRS